MSDIDHLQKLYGQIAALEHLVLALYEAHPNKSAVQADFLRQTERNAGLDLYSTQPEPFLEGFSIRQKLLAERLAASISSR